MFKERKAKRKRFIVGQLREKVNLTSGLATAQSTHAGECTDRAADQTDPITSNYRNSLWWDFDWVGCGENQLKCFNFQRFSRTISRSRFSCVKFRLISKTSFLTWLNNERSPIVAHDVSTTRKKLLDDDISRDGMWKPFAFDCKKTHSLAVDTRIKTRIFANFCIKMFYLFDKEKIFVCT